MSEQERIRGGIILVCSQAHAGPQLPVGGLPTAAAPSGTSTADELSKLAALAQNGTITQQEFEDQKTELLSAVPCERP